MSKPKFLLSNGCQCASASPSLLFLASPLDKLTIQMSLFKPKSKLQCLSNFQKNFESINEKITFCNSTRSCTTIKMHHLPGLLLLITH